MVADTVMPIRPEWLTAGGSARAQFYRVRDVSTWARRRGNFTRPLLKYSPMR